MTRSPIRIFLFLLLTLAISVYGQEAGPAKAQISANEILQKNLIATGGLEAHKALETLVTSGDWHIGNMHRLGDYLFSYKAPSNDVLEVQVISHGTSWTGHRGERLFRRATFGGIPRINGISTEIVEQDWRSLMEWDFCCAYDRIELVGIGEVENRPAYGVRFTPKHGDSFVRFYDRETFLLVRTDQLERFRVNNQGPERIYVVKSYFRDYRTQGSIKLPMTVAIPVGEGELVFEVSKIKANEAVADSVFQ